MSAYTLNNFGTAYGTSASCGTSVTGINTTTSITPTFIPYYTSKDWIEVDGTYYEESALERLTEPYT